MKNIGKLGINISEAQCTSDIGLCITRNLHLFFPQSQQFLIYCPCRRNSDIINCCFVFFRICIYNFKHRLSSVYVIFGTVVRLYYKRQRIMNKNCYYCVSLQHHLYDCLNRNNQGSHQNTSFR